MFSIAYIKRLAFGMIFGTSGWKLDMFWQHEGERNLSNKETLGTTEQDEKVEKVVYAVLEREEDEVTSNDSPYLNVIHWHILKIK